MMRLIFLLPAACRAQDLFLAANGTAADDPGGCNVDLQERGLLNCKQVCEDWCWATVIAEMEAWYQRQDALEAGLEAPLQTCKQDECVVVADVTGKDCCAIGCGTSTAQGTCGQAGPLDVISSQLTKRTGRSFKQVGVISESKLQQLLKEGNPVPASSDSHIDIIAGCSTDANGKTAYYKIDSLEGPGDPHQQYLWYDSYDLLSYGGQWKYSFVPS